MAIRGTMEDHVVARIQEVILKIEAAGGKRIGCFEPRCFMELTLVGDDMEKLVVFHTDIALEIRFVVRVGALCDTWRLPFVLAGGEWGDVAPFVSAD